MFSLELELTLRKPLAIDGKTEFSDYLMHYDYCWDFCWEFT